MIGSASTMTALGYFVGPPIGGSLYTISGFSMPFIVLSALVVLCAAPCVWLFPRYSSIDTSSEGMMPVDTPPSDCTPSSANERAPSAKKQSVLQIMRLLPLRVWVVAAISFFYTSKWAWWDIYFTSWLLHEFSLPIATSSLLISFIAATFALTGPLSGMLGDRLGKRRLELMNICLVFLAGTYLAMGPWQQRAWAFQARSTMLYFYLVIDGIVCCLIEPQLIPEMRKCNMNQAVTTALLQSLTPSPS